MHYLKYKNFLGSINFSQRDGVYYGKIEDIEALVNYEGNDIFELTQAFHDAVEDYLYIMASK